jgi:hypothetical protein
MNRLGLNLQHLLLYADEGEDMLNSTGDETWVHHYQPESKRASMQWKHPSSPQPKSLRLRHQLGRSRLACFGIVGEYS